VAAKLEGDVIDNGRPVKAAPVIRRVEVAEEDTSSRVLTRLVPAFVISGAVHVVAIGFILLVVSGPKQVTAKPSDDLVTTQVEEPKEDEKNLTNDDVGLDPALTAATNADREETVNVDVPKTDDPVGLPDQSMEVAPLTQLAGLGADLKGGAIGDASQTGELMTGPGGGASTFTTPGMRGRSGATKDKLLREGRERPVRGSRGVRIGLAGPPAREGWVMEVRRPVEGPGGRDRHGPVAILGRRGDAQIRDQV